MASGGAAPAEPPAPHPPRTVEVAPQDWWRVHPFDAASGRYASTAFNDNAKADARFSPLLPGTSTGALVSSTIVSSIYAAATLEGALMESVLHDAPFPSAGYQHNFKRDRAGRHHVSRIRNTRPLRLVDLTSLGLSAMGLKPSDLFENNKPDYPRTRRWAAWLREVCPDAQGFVWMSRRNNQSAAIVLFEDHVAAGVLAEQVGPMHVSAFEATTLTLLERLGGSAAPDI